MKPATLTPQEVRKLLYKIQGEIARHRSAIYWLEADLKTLQAKCPHERVADGECRDCGKEIKE